MDGEVLRVEDDKIPADVLAGANECAVRNKSNTSSVTRDFMVVSSRV